MTNQVNITIDYDRCVGTAMCKAFAKKTFGLNEKGLAVVVDPPGDDTDRIVNAAEQCPMGAITVKDEATGAVLFAG